MRRLAGPTTGLCQRRLALQQQQHQQQREGGPWHAQKRYYLENSPRGTVVSQGRGSQKKTFPTFELPNLVLDLDAEDSPHVRPFDKKKDGPLQRSQWGYDPAVDEAEEFSRKMTLASKKDLGKLHSVTTSPEKALRRVHISDLDV
ncbi:hypothetical protein M406DRAFT_354487, partial [Cryphonectria parasitica EP155]